MNEPIVLQGEVLVSGQIEGSVVSTTEMLSFWGGFNPDTGIVVDRHHSLYGKSLNGKILVIPHGKGSSTGSPVLVDAIMSRNAPAAIILNKIDEIIALGAIVSKKFFQHSIPIIVLSDKEFKLAMSAKKASISIDGKVTIY